MRRDSISPVASTTTLHTRQLNEDVVNLMHNVTNNEDNSQYSHYYEQNVHPFYMKKDSLSSTTKRLQLENLLKDEKENSEPVSFCRQ